VRRTFKWVAGILGVLVLVVGIAVVLGLQLGQRKKMRVVHVALTPLAYVTDGPSMERGRYLFQSRGCVDCHAANGGGRDLVNDGKGTHIAGPNITSAGVVAKYQAVDWDRSIRHGIKPDGRPILVMPSEDFNRFTNTDLMSLVSYVRGLAPVQGGAAVVDLPLPARVLYGFGVIPDAAGRIDHRLPPSDPVPSGVTVAHGAYVANMCIGCHGAKLSGGKISTGPPDWPAAANITPGDGSVMRRYKDADTFLAMFRSGKRPDGTTIAVMPFESFSKMNDVDIRALHAFLQTVPARSAGQH
jgi:mono/diheme cytochrome c family protein